jgi:hypothetical protein
MRNVRGLPFELLQAAKCEHSMYRHANFFASSTLLHIELLYVVIYKYSNSELLLCVLCSISVVSTHNVHKVTTRLRAAITQTAQRSGVARQQVARSTY